ncbi:MAG TPA: amino acid adenylation domain-containing protein [Cellulomonas sp.]
MSAGGRLALTPERRRLLEQRLAAEGVHRSAAPGVRPAAAPAPGERDRTAPLTVAQRRMWFLERLSPGTSPYVIPAAVRLVGPLDPEALVTAFDDVVQRHEALRTTIEEVDGRPVQVVHDVLCPEVVRTDLRPDAHPDDQPEPSGPEVWRERFADLVARPFDLRHGPLLRVELLTVGPQDHVLLLVLHHIVADQWSMGVLVQDLAQACAARSAGRPPVTVPLTVQYADHARHQEDRAARLGTPEGLDFWLRTLAGAPAEHGLPLTRPRPPQSTFRGASVPVTVPAPLAGRLRDLGHAHGATLFMVLAAAFHVVLHRLGAGDDLVVGTPVANRDDPAVEPVVGLFVNTVALRTDLSGDPSFIGLLERVRDTCLSAFEHGDVPFEQVVEALRPERSLSRTPVFQVMLTYQNAPVPLHLGGAVTAVPLTPDVSTAKVDLTLNLSEQAGALVGRVEYSLDVLDEAVARCVARALLHVLRAVVHDPTAAIGDLPLMAPHERRETLLLGRAAPLVAPAGAPVAGVPDLVREQVRLRPDALAVRTERRAVTYAELDRRTARLAHRLRERGVGPGAVVGLCLDDGLDVVTAVLAVWRVGAAYLPLDPGHPAARSAFLLRNGGAGVVLAAPSTRAALPEDRAADAVVLRDGEVDAPGPVPDDPDAAVDGEDLAYLIHTSGSTAAPKGVEVRHRNLVSYVTAVAARVGLGRPGDRYGLLQPPVTDLGNTLLFVSLATGGELHVLDRAHVTEPSAVAAFVADRRLDHLKIVPSHLVALSVGRGVADLFPARTLLLGGEAPPAALVADLLAVAGDRAVVNHYGPTETTVGACTCRLEPRHLAEGVLPVGRPLPGVDVYVLDERREPVPVGAVGELWIGGAGVARGYVGQPGLTGERFVPDPSGAPGALLYRTGDRARWRADGELVFLGRRDSETKVRGFRVDPAEVEEALAADAEVLAAAVRVRTDEHRGTHLVGYVVPADRAAGAGLGDRVLRGLADRLPAHLHPAAVVVLDRLPLTSAGKVDRSALPERALAADCGAAAPGTPPRDAVEAAVAQECADLLGLARVGVEDDFFALGGHSLLAVQLVSRVGARHEVSLLVRDFLARPTVAALAALVRRADPLVPVPTADRSRPLPLALAQERLCGHSRVPVEDAFHHVPTTLRLSGALDAEALGRALDALVVRHEALRTRFVQRDGRWWQEPRDDEAGWPLRRHDLAGSGPARAELGRLLDADRRLRFRLAQEPPVRGLLIRTGPDEHVLQLVLHHLVTDNWSYGVLSRDLSELYRAEVDHRRADLPVLRAQPADLAAAQRADLDSGAREADAQYWAAQLSGVAALDLGAPSVPGVPPATGFQQGFVLGADGDGDGGAARGVAALARRAGTTPFVVLLSAYGVLLSAWSGRDDLLVAYPSAGRERAGSTEVIGFFVEHTAVRLTLDAAEPFLALVARTHAAVLAGAGRRGYPLWTITERAPTGRDPLRVVFNLLNAPLPALSLPGLTVAPHSEATSYVFSEIGGDIGSAAEVDLGLVMREDGDRLRGLWLYTAGAVDPGGVALAVDRWSALLDAVLAGPDRTIGDLASTELGGFAGAGGTAGRPGLTAPGGAAPATPRTTRTES